MSTQIKITVSHIAQQLNDFIRKPGAVASLPDEERITNYFLNLICLAFST